MSLHLPRLIRTEHFVRTGRTARILALMSATALTLLSTSPVFAANPVLSSLHVTGPNGPQSAGQTITYTAQAQGNGGTPEYQFWLDTAQGWRIVQNYSTKNTFSLHNIAAGSYPVVVQALDQNQVQAGDWSQAQHQDFFVNVDSTATLSLPTSFTAGKAVTVTATSTHLFDPVYQLWYKTPAGQWVQSGDYQNSGTFTFTPTQSGTYQAIVYAKDVLAPALPTFAVTDIHTMTSTAASGTPTPTPTGTINEAQGTWTTVATDAASTPPLTALTLSPNGQQLATLNASGQVSLINPSNGTATSLGTAPGYQTTFIPNMFQIGWGLHGTLYTINQYSLDRYINGQWQQDFGQNAPWQIGYKDGVAGPSPRHFISTAAGLDVWTNNDGIWQFNGTTWQEIAGSSNPYPHITFAQLQQDETTNNWNNVPMSYSYPELQPNVDLRPYSFVATTSDALYSQYVPQSWLTANSNNTNYVPAPFSQVVEQNGQWNQLPTIPNDPYHEALPLLMNPQTQALTAIVYQAPTSQRTANYHVQALATFNSQSQAWQEISAPLNHNTSIYNMASQGIPVVSTVNHGVYAWQNQQWQALSQNSPFTSGTVNYFLVSGSHGILYAGTLHHIYRWTPQS